MAISTFQLCEDKTQKSVYSVTSKDSSVTQCRLVEINYANGSITSGSNKRMKSKLSPYLPSDRLQLLSRRAEKKQAEFLSSFPLAVNLYKANSDEFKLKKRRGKKNKKSVLTLPNEPAALPQSCTVSDMNDSEYFNSENKIKAKKRLKTQTKKNISRPRRDKNLEFYDRDAKYCSQVNINLDCSSTDMIKNFKGDRKNQLKDFYSTKKNDEEVQPHDVWAVLRNINRFQFHPSPPVSDDSIIVSPRKKKGINKKNKRKGARVIETCRTEQYAYISNIDVGSKSVSRASSMDRITVIQGSVKELRNRQSNQYDNHSSFKTKTKGDKVMKNKPRSKKAHNQLKVCSPDTGKHEEHSAYNEEDLGCCRMIKNNYDDSLILSRKSHVSNDLDSHKEDDDFRDSPCQITTEIEFAHSSPSGSNFSVIGRGKGKHIKFCKTPLQESRTKMNGSNKIVLSKGQELAISKRLSLTRKPRLVTTMPSSGPVPKLTLSDIRRRIANIKFPIVILGKDQLSATIEVLPYDYSQFDGLDKHIWPFMIEWSEDGKDVFNPNMKDEKKPNDVLDHNLTTNAKRPTNFLALNKQCFKGRKLAVAEINLTSPRQKEIKPLPLNHMNIPYKPKPIRQFRDKMLKLLYKKTSSQNIVNENLQTDGGQGDVNVKPANKIETKRCNTMKNVNKDKTIDYYTKSAEDKKDKSMIRQVPTSPSNLLVPKQQWGKAKWASAFIDNVIKKIKAGTYYSHDTHDNNENSKTDSKLRNDSKEVSIQAGVPLNSIGINVMEGYEDLTPKITIQKKKEPPTYLPGFDDELPQLEIKAISPHQIAVKHCITNVMLQFDVCVPIEHEQASSNFKRSMSCVPLTITESKTKVFKCKARLVNAMLPAEICTILPKLMNKLENPEGKLALPSVRETSVDSCLTPITELSASDIVASYTNNTPLIPHIMMSLELRILANGKFATKLQQSSKCCRKYILNAIELPLLLELLPKIRINRQDYLESPEYPMTSKPEKINTSSISITTLEPNNLCTDLVPFNSSEATSPILWNQHSEYAQCMLNKFYTFLQREMPNSVQNRNSVHIPDFGMKPLYNITVNLKFDNPNQISNTVTIDVNQFKVESLYSALSNIVSPKTATEKSGAQLKCIEYITHAEKPKMNKVSTRTQPNVVVHKHKKRVYVKLYKKCKSTSHISVEKSGSTSLSKITNMEEFFLSLGTNKPLCDAFDGYSGRKILASIIEMKSWINEISPRQSLLVLLLSNKKDTPNLVRFRPVILQGIAVNRITLTSELDMEIEVIERESFNKLSEHEGTPNVPSPVHYDDNLLEELYWIAKTTASDYQRVFDESSEMLLKALLEKRKKLNPSYLRVMARYVGLGLLKSPAKN